MKPEDLKGIVHSDPEIMGGTPVFVGTRVPLQNLIDCLEGGESVEDFLEAYPTVKREQAIAALQWFAFANSTGRIRRALNRRHQFELSAVCDKL